jgi:tetratricopeptide (TPR) repeat protein
MRAVAGGFLIDLGPQRGAMGKLPEGDAARVASAGARRLFDLPPLAIPALVNRQQAAAGAAAAAARRARGSAQLALAQSMVALGLSSEAQAVLRLAMSEDGRLAGNPVAVALSAVAALLADRPAESGGLDDPVVLADEPGADEIALWQAWRTAKIASAAGGPVPQDAVRMLARQQAIALSYPMPIRARMLPLLVETLVDGGQTAPAERLIAAAGEQPGLDFARAILDARAGRIDPALARLDRLAASPDRSERARAAVRAVELRLAAGQLSPTKAADAMDPLIAAWRGDGRELAVRLRVADLRLQAGQLRASLAVLREALVDGGLAHSPDGRLAEVRARMEAAFALTLKRDDATPMEPLEFVSLIEDNADLLPTGADGDQIARRVADRLAALDLPERAERALRKLVDGAPPGEARAAFGARLAAMQVGQGDFEGALVSLSASTMDKLPGPLVAARTLTYARATAAKGNIAAATGVLEALDTSEADSLRAELLAKTGDWGGATAALSRRVERELPGDGPITSEQSALVLQFASAAAQAGQPAVLERIRIELLPRLPPGRDADLLRVLTAGPVAGVADLPRAAQEAALARSVTR